MSWYRTLSFHLPMRSNFFSNTLRLRHKLFACGFSCTLGSGCSGVLRGAKGADCSFGEVTFARRVCALRRGLTAFGSPLLLGPRFEAFLAFCESTHLYPPPAFLYFVASICAFLALHCPGAPPLPPALICSKSCLRLPGFV